MYCSQGTKASIRQALNMCAVSVAFAVRLIWAFSALTLPPESRPAKRSTAILRP